ncbi:MAG: leucine-rich repeat protein [Lachnospiraceae bacterium]|nr:leucine-rich repeat protein [Lachnospiraceae bacterium]
MYRKLKNILGVSLMVLAIVISQIPMPEAQAAKELTEQDMQVDDISAHTVTFSMNGGSFDGEYNGYSFDGKTPVLVVDDGEAVTSFPDDKFASYSGFQTESNVWYTDKECLNQFDTDSHVRESMTLYKKWYQITSDGSAPAEKGFHISADGTILYRYDGDEKHVQIPQTVTTIAESAFDNLQQVRGITLPAGIQNVEGNAFSGVTDGSIIYIYDSGSTDSIEYGKKLADEYEQLVYSEYLDVENTEQIVGIDYQSDTSDEEKPEEREGSETGEDSRTESEESKTEEKETQESNAGEDDKQGDSTTVETEPENSSAVESGTDETEESSSTVIVVEPDTKYTVTFDTGIAGVDGEKREVLSRRTVSELVSVDGNQPEILRKDDYRIEKDDGKQDITYIFKGWYQDKGFTKEWDFDNDMIESDTTIYAKWDKQTRAYFYVTFVAAEGYESAANIPEKQKLYEDENLEKPAKKPSVKNKVFKGWYTDEKDTSTEYKTWGKPITKDLTLYAQFEEKSYTVVFHMNGGGFTGSYNGTSYTDAASLKTKITAGKGIASTDYPQSSSSSSFKYSNYATDSNWYKDKEGLTIYSQSAALNGDLTLYKKWYYTSSGFTLNASSNVLYKYSGSVADVAIPNSVTIIGADAFSSVGSISSITLPDNISDVKDNAFSGVQKISKDITITGKTEKAKNVAKALANQYTHLVYKDGAPTDNSVVVTTTTESGSIRLGAAISGTAGTSGTTPPASAGSTAAQSGSIALGAGSIGTGTTAAQTVTPAAQGNVISQGTIPAQGAAASQNNTSATAQKDTQVSKGSSASVQQGAKTTSKQNVTSASAPRSTEHIKDSTPKTGDPLQYRMLIVCAMFSVGALLVLTGNGRKKRFSAS